MSTRTLQFDAATALREKIQRLEAEIARLRDLASLGEAAAAIVHEIKNPLAAISGPLQVIRERIDQPAEYRTILDEVIAEVHRLDAMVRRLLMLSKPWNPRKEQHDLLDIIRRVVTLTRAEPAFSRVSVRLHPAASASVAVDAALFEQVLWNLLQNAAEAMTDGGDVRINCQAARGGATVRILDTGPGMSPEVLNRLYKPFFTTKPGGNGLGLSICRKIMEAHGGSIRILSRMGKGTEVQLTLPNSKPS